MIIAGVYSFKDGLACIKSKYPYLLNEIYQVIAAIDVQAYKTKQRKKKTIGNLKAGHGPLVKTYCRIRLC